jgi:hypothetical protein
LLVDAFIDELDMAVLGFEGMVPAAPSGLFTVALPLPRPTKIPPLRMLPLA